MYFIHPSKKKTNITSKPMRTTPTTFLFLITCYVCVDAVRFYCFRFHFRFLQQCVYDAQESNLRPVSYPSRKQKQKQKERVLCVFSSWNPTHILTRYIDIRDIPRKVVWIDEIRKRRLRPRCRWASRRWTSYTPWIFKWNEGYGVTV